MKKFNIYDVTFKDGVRVTIPAQTKKQALEKLYGNGEVIGIVDTTLLYELPNFYILQDVLFESHAFTDEQIDIMTKALEQVIDMDYSYKMRIDVRNAL